MGREIVRPEHANDAVWLVAHRDLVAHRRLEPALWGAFGIGVDGNLDLVDHGTDLGLGFPEGLPRLARDQRREFGFALAHDIGEAAHGLDAKGMGVRRPLGPGGARGGDFGGSIANLARPDFVAGRGIVGDEGGGHGHALHYRRRFVNLPHPAPLLRPFSGWH